MNFEIILFFSFRRIACYDEIISLTQLSTGEVINPNELFEYSPPSASYRVYRTDIDESGKPTRKQQAYIFQKPPKIYALLASQILISNKLSSSWDPKELPPGQMFHSQKFAHVFANVGTAAAGLLFAGYQYQAFENKDKFQLDLADRVDSLIRFMFSNAPGEMIFDFHNFVDFYSQNQDSANKQMTHKPDGKSIGEKYLKQFLHTNFPGWFVPGPGVSLDTFTIDPYTIGEDSVFYASHFRDKCKDLYFKNYNYFLLLNHIKAKINSNDNNITTPSPPPTTTIVQPQTMQVQIAANYSPYHIVDEGQSLLYLDRAARHTQTEKVKNILRGDLNTYWNEIHQHINQHLPYTWPSTAPQQTAESTPSANSMNFGTSTSTIVSPIPVFPVSTDTSTAAPPSLSTELPSQGINFFFSFFLFL